MVSLLNDQGDFYSRRAFHNTDCDSCQAKVLIKIDLDSQRLSATKASGESVVWKISSGRSGYETPAGHFSVMRMERDHHSDEYDQAPMPYAMFFSPRGLAIHGTFEKALDGRRLMDVCGLPFRMRSSSLIGLKKKVAHRSTSLGHIKLQHVGAPLLIRLQQTAQ